VWPERLFKPYRGHTHACFLCDATIPPAERICTTIVGDLADAEKCVAIPLCSGCGDLPKMVKWNRVLKVFRAIRKARTGKDAHYQTPRWH